MEYPAVTRAQKQKLSDWVSSGFKQYIERWGGEDVEEDALIRRYAKEFNRIVCGDNVEIDDVDMPKLWADLEELVSKNCPAIDVVEFMLSSTSGLQATFEDCLDVVGLSLKHLEQLKEACAWSAEIIRTLRKPHVPGPFLLLEELLPEGVSVEAVRHQIEGLPDALTNFAHLLQNCPPAYDAWVNHFLEHPGVPLFYLVLRYYGKGSPTLSLLLKTMRRVKRIVSPDEKYLHPFDPIPVKRTQNAGASQEPRNEKRDPLGEKAIEKQLYRLFQNEGLRKELEATVRRYLSDECAEQRRSGESLSTLLGKLWQTMDDEASD